MKIQPKKSLKDCTSSIYNAINARFEKTFRIPFSEGLTNIPEINLQIKPTHNERRKEKRTLVRKVKADLQKELDATAVDRCFGTRQSLNKWDNLRAIQSFETVIDAKKRTKEMGEKSSSW